MQRQQEPTARSGQESSQQQSAGHGRRERWQTCAPAPWAPAAARALYCRRHRAWLRAGSAGRCGQSAPLHQASPSPHTRHARPGLLRPRQPPASMRRRPISVCCRQPACVYARLTTREGRTQPPWWDTGLWASVVCRRPLLSINGSINGADVGYERAVPSPEPQPQRHPPGLRHQQGAPGTEVASAGGKRGDALGRAAPRGISGRHRTRSRAHGICCARSRHRHGFLLAPSRITPYRGGDQRHAWGSCVRPAQQCHGVLPRGLKCSGRCGVCVPAYLQDQRRAALALTAGGGGGARPLLWPLSPHPLACSRDDAQLGGPAPRARTTRTRSPSTAAAAPAPKAGHPPWEQLRAPRRSGRLRCCGCCLR